MDNIFSYEQITSHIRQLLTSLGQYIELSNKQGTSDINVACENLVLCLMNKVYGYNLVNYNGKMHKCNAAGIDLVDYTQKVCVQVTSKHDSKKLKDTLKGYKTANLQGFKLMFFVIQDDAKSLHKKKDKDIGFDGEHDVVDFNYFCDKLSDLKDPIMTAELHAMLCTWLGVESYYTYDNLKNRLDLQQKRYQYSVPQGYIPRYLSVNTGDEDNSYIDRFLHPEKYQLHTLVEYVKGEVPEHQSQYWLLMAAGQTGKSYEARNLAYKLAKETDLFPVFYEAKYFTSSACLYIPFWWDVSKMVLIIDGYDEVADEDSREILIQAIENLECDLPTLRIVLTTRRNYIRDNSVLSDFHRLHLEELCYHDVELFVNESGVEQPQKFLQLIEQFDLYSQIYVPFYLDALLKYYKKNGDVPENKFEIYRFIIDESFNGDTQKKPARTISLKVRGNVLMRKLALVLQFTGKKELSAEELYDNMGFSEDDIHNCERYSIFHRADNGMYCFEKNSYQMYYVANYLMDGKSADEILDIISYREYGSNRIRPEWYDVFELLLSVMKPDDSTRVQLLEWTINHHPEALLNVDYQTLEPTFCNRLFKGLLLDYKHKRISSSPELGWNFDKRLARLCQTKDSIAFFAKEYENETELGPYLYLLSFILWFIKPSVIEKFGFANKIKEIAYRNLLQYGDTETHWYEAPYTPFENDIFNTKEDIDKLIELTATIQCVLLKKQVYDLIKKTNLCDRYVDFSIANEDKIHDYRCQNDDAIHSLSRDSVYYTLSHVKEYDSLKKVWNHYSNLVERRYSRLAEETMHNYREQLLTNTSALLISHPDLANCIDAAWLTEYLVHFHYANIPADDKIYLSFRNFFVANNLCDNALDLLAEFQRAHRGDYDYDNLSRLRAKLFLRLKPGDIAKYKKACDTNEDSFKFMAFALRSIPVPAVAEEIRQIVAELYPEVKESSNDNNFYESKRDKDLAQALNCKAFKQHVADTVERYTFKNSKELRLCIKDDDLKVNDFIYSYLHFFQKGKSNEYDVEKIKSSLRRNMYYNMFLVNLVSSNRQFKYTAKHKNAIKKAIIALLSMKKHGMNDNGVVLCLDLAIKFDFDLPQDVVINNLKFAGRRNFHSDSDKDLLHYANEKFGVDVVKPYVAELLGKPKVERSWSNISALIVYAAEFELYESYKDVCRHITETKDSSVNLADCFCRGNAENGLDIMMAHFNLLPPAAQLYIARKASEKDENSEWIVDSLNKARTNYAADDNKSAIKFLLRYGDEQALNECMTYIQADSNLLCSPHDVPPFRFSDLKFLPQMLQIMQLTWGITDHFNNWYSRMKETIQLMASQSNEQFDIVIERLTKLAESDSKYSTIHYFIGELKSQYDPRITKIPQMKIKDVMRTYID